MLDGRARRVAGQRRSRTPGTLESAPFLEVLLRSAIADYQVVRPLDTHEGPGARYLVEAPARLGLPTDAVVVVHLVALGDSVAWSRLLARLAVASAVERDRTGGHARLAEILEAGRDDDVGWISARHPATNLTRDAALSRPRRLQAIIDACRGAHRLHEAGLAHGAISPAEIWFDTQGALLGPTPRWAEEDGVAWPAGPARDLVYADPELLKGSPPSRASDLWALGAVLHGALSDQDLYDDPVGPATTLDIERHRDTPPAIDSLIPPALGEIVTWCLSADPAGRPRSALALAQRIEAEVWEPL
jgi:hypothetical protein